MKHFFSGMLMTLALVLAIVVGVVALAETAGPETPELPAVEDAQAPDEPAAPATDASDATALQDALNAYRAAKQSAQSEELETELNGYVASGKLTQEQADLILNYYKEQESLRNGVCPNCGYAFQNNGGFGKGGRMNGMKGGKGGRGGMRGGFGGMNGFSQTPSPDQQSGATPDAGSANGTAFEPEWDFQADEADFGGI